MEYTKITYQDLLNNCKKNFLSLDISVVSTGYVLWYNNQLTYGYWQLKSKDNRDRRMEFGKYIAELLKNKTLDYIVIEDVIAGCNFKTTRILTELNIMPETLMDFNIIPNIPVYRKGNKEWKKELKYLAQTETIRGDDDKQIIVSCLHSLEFCPDVVQDIYDAMGIALAYIYDSSVAKPEDNTIKIKTLKTSLDKGYKIKQYSSKDEMLEAVNKIIKRSKKKREFVYFEYDNTYRNLLLQFKDIVYQNGDEKIFCIHAPLNKIGAMIVTQGFDLSKDDVYFTAVR